MWWLYCISVKCWWNRFGKFVHEFDTFRHCLKQNNLMDTSMLTSKLFKRGRFDKLRICLFHFIWLVGVQIYNFCNFINFAFLLSKVSMNRCIYCIRTPKYSSLCILQFIYHHKLFQCAITYTYMHKIDIVKERCRNVLKYCVVFWWFKLNKALQDKIK